MQAQSLGREDPLEGMATRSSILAWRIPWTEEPGGLQSKGSQRVMTEATEHTRTHTYTRHTANCEFLSVSVPLTTLDHNDLFQGQKHLT